MAPLADVLRDRPDEYSSAPEKYFFGQRMGAPGMSAQQEAYELQKRYAGDEIEQGFLQPDDFVPGKALTKALKFGGLAAGALLPKTGREKWAVDLIRESFSPPFLNRIESTTPRALTKGGISTVEPNRMPNQDVRAYVKDSLTELLHEPEMAVAFRNNPNFKATSESHLGLAHLPPTDQVKKGGLDKPWIAMRSSALKQGTGVHEAAHIGFMGLRPSTQQMLERSFVKRGDELERAFEDIGDTHAVRYLRNLRYATDPSAPDMMTLPERYRATNEILARLLQGRVNPTGPERHLLSPVGRALAQTRAEENVDLLRMLRP